MSEDPIGFKGNDENFYRYVSNNPIIYRDPSGNLKYTAAACTFFISTGVALDAADTASTAASMSTNSNKKKKKCGKNPKTPSNPVCTKEKTSD